MNLDRVVAGARKADRLTRGAVLSCWIRIGGGTVGRGLEVERGTTLRWAPHSGLRLGAGVRLGRGVVLDAPPGAVLRLDDRVKVMHYTVIGAMDSVVIGADTQVAEHVSIRDMDHGTDVSAPFADQAVTAPVRIGQGAWIARGVAVLRGADIGAQAVIGANSVVRGAVPARSVAVGAPARVVKHLA